MTRAKGVQITSVSHTSWGAYTVIKTTTLRNWYANIFRHLDENKISSRLIQGPLRDESKLTQELLNLGAPVPVEWKAGNGQERGA